MRRLPGLVSLLVAAVLLVGAAGCSVLDEGFPEGWPWAFLDGGSEPTATPQPTVPPEPTPSVQPGPHTKEPTTPETPPAPGGGGTPSGPSKPAPTDNATRGWYYVPNTTHAVPAVAPGAKDLLAAYGGRYLGPDPGRVYLTFDEGYENGNTPAILDALARNGVKATFFVTESYIRNNPGLVRRMANEGHVVGNHSSTHPSMPSLATDRTRFASELTKTAQAYAEVTGRQMARIFRPPMGEYSPLSLWLTQSLGYESVFWSFAHRDWVVDDQPPVEVTVQRILTGSHPGAIYLLHGVSSSDTQALDAAIAGLKAQGYGFGTLAR